MTTQRKDRNEEKDQRAQNRGNQQEGGERQQGRNAQEDQRDSGNDQGSERGFAAMDDNKQRKIASKGGKAVSKDKQHMAEIGRKGGKN